MITASSAFITLQMPADSNEPPTSAQWRVSLAGMLIGDVAVGLLYLAGTLLLNYTDTIGMLGVPSFLLVPAFGGLVASYVWRGLKPTISATFLNAIYMTVFALLGATLIFHEGAICLIIVSPLFFVSLLTGALLGRILFKTYPTRLQLGLLPLLTLGVLVEPLTRRESSGVITDEILIHAPPAKVWRELTSFPEITSPPRFWLFRLGLPYPTATRSEGNFVNASRECVFSKGALFKERVIEFVPSERLTFDIIESPKDPELVGHLTPQRGQFRLQANVDGTTTLFGSTWYSLHVRPLWYFDFWTHHVFRSVHMRVMEHIRLRAERTVVSQ